MTRVTEDEQAVEGQIQQMVARAQALRQAEAKLRELLTHRSSADGKAQGLRTEGQELAKRCSTARQDIRSLVVLDLSDGVLAQLLEVNDALLAALTQWDATAAASRSPQPVQRSAPHTSSGVVHRVTVAVSQGPNTSAKAPPSVNQKEPVSSLQIDSVSAVTGIWSSGWKGADQPAPQRKPSTAASSTDAWAHIESLGPASMWAGEQVLPSAAKRPVLSEAIFSQPPPAQQASTSWQNFGTPESSVVLESLPGTLTQSHSSALAASFSTALQPHPGSSVRPVLSETDFSQLPAAQLPPSGWGRPVARDPAMTGPSLPNSLTTISSQPSGAFVEPSSNGWQAQSRPSSASSASTNIAGSASMHHADDRHQLAGQRSMGAQEAAPEASLGQAGRADSLSVRLSQAGDEDAEEPWTPDGEEVEPWTEFGSPEKVSGGQGQPIPAAIPNGTVSNGQQAQPEASGSMVPGAASSMAGEGLGQGLEYATLHNTASMQAKDSRLLAANGKAMGDSAQDGALHMGASIPATTSAQLRTAAPEDDAVDLRMEIMQLHYQQQQHLAQLNEAAKRDSLHSRETAHLQQQVTDLQQKTAAFENEKRSLMLLLDEAAAEQRRLGGLLESMSRQLLEKDEQVTRLAQRKPPTQPKSPTRMVSDCSSLPNSAWLATQDEKTPRPRSARPSSPPDRALEAYYHQPALRVRFSAAQFQDLTEKLHLPKAARAQSLRLP